MKIKRPDWEILNYQDPRTWSAFDAWFDTHVKPINKMLEQGVEVTGWRLSEADVGAGDNIGEWTCGSGHDSRSTHKALLINLQPIKQETAEDVLRQCLENGNFVNNVDGWLVKKVKNVLESKNDT
jgi:hypothetical protein